MCNFPLAGIDFLPIRYLYIQLSGNGFLKGRWLKDFALVLMVSTDINCSLKTIHVSLLAVCAKYSESTLFMIVFQSRGIDKIILYHRKIMLSGNLNSLLTSFQSLKSHAVVLKIFLMLSAH